MSERAEHPETSTAADRGREQVTGGAEPADEPERGDPGGTPEAPAEDSGHVPDKQIHRWKDDGGAVIFNG